MTNVLSPDAISALRDELDERGYVVLRDVVSKAGLAELNVELSTAYANSEKFKGGGSYTGHLNCYPGKNARFTYDDIAAAGIVDLVRSVKGDAADHPRATLNFNLPGSVAQHYHMDGLYVEDFVVVNIAVVDTTLANGAIDVLPGTNKRFYKFWQYALKRCYRRTTRLEMQAGDVLIRKSTLWHRGMPNNTKVPRPLMSITFGETSAPEGDPFMEDGGAIRFYPNWYSTSKLSQLRERLFMKAPPLYSAYRFAKSLTGNRGFDRY
jgi:ectoine hydroxylase-related dioxygenase (phytanoyl-CoA dioxygenase family)